MLKIYPKLDADPIIDVPIDGVTNDLRDWARTLKYKVKLWLVNKFVEFNNPTNVVLCGYASPRVKRVLLFIHLVFINRHGRS